MSMTSIVYGNFVGGRGAMGLLILRVVAGLAFMFHGCRFSTCAFPCS